MMMNSRGQSDMRQQTCCPQRRTTRLASLGDRSPGCPSSGCTSGLAQKVLLVVAILLVSAGCATTGEQSSVADPPVHNIKDAQPATESEVPAVSAEVNVSEEQGAGVAQVEIYTGSGVFVNEELAATRAAPVSADGEIVLNFEGESIQSVIHTILGEVLQENFVIAPGVSGEVTFSTSRAVSRDQLLPILEMILQWNGATLVHKDGRYQVLPVANAIAGNLSPQMGDIEGAQGYEVMGVALKYIAAAEMAKILEPYIREGAMVQADQFRSMLFLAGTPEELASYMRIVQIFDVDWLKGMSVGIYPLRTVDVSAIIGELQGIFGTEGDTPLAGMFRFIPLERLSSIMVITYQPEYLTKAEEWIKILDRGAAGAGKQLYVYRVKNLEAPILAGYLTQIFGGEGGTPTSNTPQGTLAPGLEAVSVGSVSDFNDSRVTAPAGGQPAAAAPAAGASVLAVGDADIRITSVLETNSLLIQATQSQYNSILSAIERIDIEPLQVLIESQVLDVELNEELQFGVNWYLTNNPALIPPGAGNPYGRYIDTAAFGSASAESGGFNFLSTLVSPLGNKTFVQATIAALDEVTDVRSLAAPSLLVRNNATATITVGTQVPVQSSSISTGNDNVVSSAQYVSTGVTLTVTPRINPGGLVYMDITQDVSRPGARDPDISTSGNPPINNKSVTSQVAVQSGQTIFLGGLIAEQSNRGRSGVPYLNRVPVIGALFGARSIAKTRSETLVMITPTVLENAREMEKISEEMREEFSRITPLHISTLVKDAQPDNH
jgi:general secretion pathway protein D